MGKKKYHNKNINSTSTESKANHEKKEIEEIEKKPHHVKPKTKHNKKSIIKKSIYITSFITIFIFCNFLLFYYFGNRDIVYEMKFDSKKENNKIKVVNGIIKNYEIKNKKDGTIYEIENYEIAKKTAIFKIKVPNNIEDYNKINIEAEFENPDYTELQIGLKNKTDMKMNEPVFDYEYHYLDNKYLNEYKTYLGENWTHIKDKKKGLTLFQKEKNFKTIDDFLKNTPNLIETTTTEIDKYGIEKPIIKKIPQIATIDYKLEPKYDFTKFTKNENEIYTYMPYSFLGSLTLFVYFDKNIANQLEVNFLKQDLSYKNEESICEIKIHDYSDKLIYYKMFGDNNNNNNPQELENKIPLNKSGIYRVTFKTNNWSFLTRNININMPKVLINNFLVVDTDEYIDENIYKQLEIFATKSNLNLSLRNKNLKQIVMINDNIHHLENKISIDLNKEKNIIIPTKNYISVGSDKPVSLEKDGLFEINKLDDYYENFLLLSNKNQYENYNYILMKYIQKKKKNATFDIRKDYIHIDDDNYIEIKLNLKLKKGSKIIINNMKISLMK